MHVQFQSDGRHRRGGRRAAAAPALAACLALSLVGDVSAGADGENGTEELRSAGPEAAWSGEGCTSCHAGIEPIRQPGTGMLSELLALGRRVGDPDGCVVCHGGTPEAVEAEAAHRGSPAKLVAFDGPDAFYPDPASPWINDRTCGQCHAELVDAQWNSLMMTEAGKIQGTLWSFGSLSGYEHRYANHDTENPGAAYLRLGTDDYRAYMATKREAHPGVYVDAHETLPEAPSTPDELDDLAQHPERAVHTYIRAECQRCHLGVKGRQARGDYRGMGCGACHLPYGNEGLYEGDDTSIPGGPGRPLVHSIQATRDAVVRVHDTEYTGIPVETCTTCHNRGKRIGVSYQGLMESAYASPFTEGGGGQLGLHTKHYVAMEQDVHYQRGMLCQDCHTSGDVHGDGFLTGCNLAAIEIECTDCHGTPDAYPWELPLGYGDENGVQTAVGTSPGPARGVAHELPRHLEQGWVVPEQDGWIRTARGNPLPETVRDGDQVVVHTAGGRTLRLDPLKKKLERDELSAAARVAMVNVTKHVQTMECYACHSSWAPQCYGCHVQIDYSGGGESCDWIAASHAHDTEAGRLLGDETTFETAIPGVVTESRSFMRWEDPPLGVNGEGRVSPVIPGCQVSVTVIGQDGEELLRNHIFRTSPHTEGAGEEGQLGIDMSPIQPHTTGAPRSCESCHGSQKALGYGIGGVAARWSEGTVVDLMTADGEVLPASARFQIEPVAGLLDWTAFVTPEGRQLQTVGHHFEGSGPLTNEQRTNMERRNVCVGCHVEIPDRDLAVSLLHHVADFADWVPETSGEHAALLNKTLRSAAWGQVLGAAALLVAAGWLVRSLLRRWRAA